MDVASFTVDHDKLLRGVYESRKDYVGEHCLTTFDIRLKLANVEPPIEIAALHTLEHLFAVYLRGQDSGAADDLIYVGPMGCRTGMYMILKGDLKPKDILPLLERLFKYVIDFAEEVPATTPKECGNYREHSLAWAQYEAKKFYNEVLKNIKDENLVYP